MSSVNENVVSFVDDVTTSIWSIKFGLYLSWYPVRVFSVFVLINIFVRNVTLFSGLSSSILSDTWFQCRNAITWSISWSISWSIYLYPWLLSRAIGDSIGFRDYWCPLFYAVILKVT